MTNIEKNTGTYNMQCYITVAIVSLVTTICFCNTLKYMKSREAYFTSNPSTK